MTHEIRAGAASSIRRLRLVLSLALCPGAAFAGGLDHDKAWGDLIAQARKLGGEPTAYKDSQSYVFFREDGTYVTLTSIPDKHVRAVCVISKDENFRVCGNWDTQEIGYGWRAGANSPWTRSSSPPVGSDRGPFETILTKLSEFMQLGMRKRRRY